MATTTTRKQPRIRPIRPLPDDTKVPFMKIGRVTLPVSAVIALISILLFVVVGPNYGIDFRGGTIIEIENKAGPADIGEIRSKIGGLGLGDVQIQEFGSPSNVLIRIEQQDGGEDAQQKAISDIRALFADTVEFRRIEIVGPRVSGELAYSGSIATAITLIAIMIYVWFRFEWQFAVGAIIGMFFDVLVTLGFFAVSGYEFNLASIAAILTVVGYSINDKVVVYDRIREILRKYKKVPIADLIDRALNETLARTTITGLTTLLALGALFVFGGEVIRSFIAAMIFGLIAGTFSSIFISAPVLIFFGLRAEKFNQPAPKPGEPRTPAAEGGAGDLIPR